MGGSSSRSASAQVWGTSSVPRVGTSWETLENKMNTVIKSLEEGLLHVCVQAPSINSISQSLVMYVTIINVGN